MTETDIDPLTDEAPSLWQRLKSLAGANSAKNGTNGKGLNGKNGHAALDGSDGDLSTEEQTLIHNVINMAELSAADVMVPRADIVAIEVDTDPDTVLEVIQEKPFSRIPVYRETLDDIVGCLHIKDIVVALAGKKEINVKKMLREVLIVSPSAEALSLMVEMRETQRHLALVVDEFGGIDGLITIADLVEAIVGEIKDEHDSDIEAQITEKADGTVVVDARVEIEDLEEKLGAFLKPDEREDIYTVGGLCMTIAGHLPVRGEILRHESGLEIEVIDSDPRQIKRIKVTRRPRVGLNNSNDQANS